MNKYCVRKGEKKVKKQTSEKDHETEVFKEQLKNEIKQRTFA